jgi:hypothetical protein
MFAFRLFQFQNQAESHIMLPPSLAHREGQVRIHQVEIDPGLAGFGQCLLGSIGRTHHASTELRQVRYRK